MLSAEGSEEGRKHVQEASLCASMCVVCSTTVFLGAAIAPTQCSSSGTLNAVEQRTAEQKKTSEQWTASK